jgi:signal transduction histidine kinase
MKYEISELIDIPRLQHLMDAFHRSTGIVHALMDNHCRILTAAGWEEVCTKYHRACDGTLKRCLASNDELHRRMWDAPFVGYQCPNGLMDYAARVMIENRHLATIFVGQIFHQPPDMAYFRRQAQEFGFDEADYLETVRRVPIVPVERMETIMAFQVELAGMLANAGLARLRQLEAEAETRRLNDDLARRIEERTKELALRTDELQRSNAELEQFAFALSHDLQEPLRMVSSYVQLIERRMGDRLDGESTEFFGFVTDGTQRMNAMICSLLEYSRLARDRHERQIADMDHVVAAALSDLRWTIDHVAGEIQLDPLPTVAGNTQQLIRLMENLIGNALKYRAEDRPPVVSVSAARHGEEWRFAVRDNGIGIECQHFERIFGLFQRLHGYGEYSGTGIGLALCKRIVERHGGRIWVESEPGAGSTFLFSLPAVAAAVSS